MSFDFQLGHVCPHTTIEETVKLGEDRRSLFLRQPLGSSTLRITANNEVTIPMSGVHSPAHLTSFSSGPFRVTKGFTGFTMKNRQGEISVNLPVGERVPVTSVVTLLQKELDIKKIQIQVSSSSGFLSFEDQFEKGPSSFVRVGGNGASSLGFSSQISSKGKEVYPPWVIDEKEEFANLTSFGVKSFRGKFPKFTKPLKGNPVLTVTYVTFRERCLRCLRTGVENDWRGNEVGEFLEVSGENLLYQAALKVILTIKGSNVFAPAYGSLLTTRIGTKAIEGVTGILQNDVLSALTIFQNLQKGQGKYQFVSPKEMLANISSINVFQSAEDPTAFGIKVVVRNASNEPVEITVVYTAPGSVALMNSRGNSLGAFGNVAGLSSIISGIS